MTYDGYGNIRTKNGVQYVYDRVWKDKLIRIGSEDISYDLQGNPTSYLGHTLTWEKGRQLKSYDNITYTYNANGIRTGKTVGDITHSYYLEGTKIIRETRGSDIIVPIYDCEDSVCGIIFNTVPYYFVKNLQGDVISITDKDAQTVARYSYDAWGACIVLSDTSGCDISAINPFRYRGYYFDTDTGLYYLQSRYYDACTGRFVNGDEASVFIFTKSITRTNLFIYCSNTPANEEDSSGYAVGDYIHAIGIQIAVTIGCVPIGIEFLWSTKTWKPTVFVFAGVAGSAAIGKNGNGIIGSVGLGVSLTNGFGLSKTYYVQLTGKDAKANNLITLFDTLRSKIKSYMDKFKTIARFIC